MREKDREVGMAGLLALVSAAVVLSACGDHEPDARGAEGGPAAAVAVAEAAWTSTARQLEATGSVEPWRRVSPGTKLLGRVDEVTVRLGDRVRRGQPLARLEKRDLEAAVRQAEAAVAMAETNLENAASQYRRIVELHGRGSVTDKALEDATTAERGAAAAVRQAQANLAAAQVMLDYAEIRAPLDGVITARLVEAGDMTAPGQPMFTVEDLSRVKVVLEVPESDVVGLERGDRARITVDVLERSWEARVERVIPSGDTLSRTYRVELALDNPDGSLKSGMFARASLARGTRQALLVPGSAIVRRGQLVGVFVVGADQIARLRWVRLGRDANGTVEVLSGLEPGERFVVAPPAGFLDGTRVQES